MLNEKIFFTFNFLDFLHLKMRVIIYMEEIACILASQRCSFQDSKSQIMKDDTINTCLSIKSLWTAFCQAGNATSTVLLHETLLQY